MESYLEARQCIRNRTFQKYRKPSDDFFWISFHIIFDPIQHDPNKDIGIYLGDKGFILIPHCHADRFFTNYSHQEIVHQRF